MADSDINAGLGNLADLKGFILAPSMRGQTDYDEMLTAIGLGVAGMLAEHCNREWPYAVGQVREQPANVSFLVANNYPINPEVPIMLEICTGWTSGAPVWTPLANAIQNVNYEAGLVYLYGYQGNYLARLRMTYDGGYWWPGLSAVQPVGSSKVPDNLRLAWLLQCQALWLVRDNLGVSVAGSGSVSFVTLTLPGYELIPEVRELLTNFIRYKMGG